MTTGMSGEQPRAALKCWIMMEPGKSEWGQRPGIHLLF